ncbi:MAG: glycosyltransferase N-terminal domain-containing protein [Gemmatimonadota bacterium]
MGFGYDLVYLTGAVLASPVWMARMLRTDKWRTDWRARFGDGAPLPASERPTILLHGVSVGEVSSLAPVVAQLEGAGTRPVVSATTDTGLARARTLYGQRLPVVRYPFDVTRAVAQFLDRVAPAAVGLTELEVWPNFMEACEARGVPVAVISGRLSASSFERYRKVRRWVAPTFAKLAAVGAQTPEYAERFVALGVPAERVRVTDSTKWDAAPAQVDEAAAARLARALGIDRSRPLVVAGSTGPGEEARLLSELPADLQVLIAPRKPERFEEVAALEPRFVRRSTSPDGSERAAGETRFLLDSMGDLSLAYALADVAIVGRSFVDLGGSDPITPVALGCASIIGPYHANFADVVDGLAAAGALLVTERIRETVADLLADPDARAERVERGRAVIEARKGSARRSADLLRALLAVEQP